MIAIRLFFLCILTAFASAQDQTTADGPDAPNAAGNRFVPKDAQIVLRLAAPSKWKTDFAETKMVRVFGGQTLAPMMQQAMATIEVGLEKAGADGVDTDLLEGLWNDYTGEVVIALHIDLEDLGAAIEDNRHPTMAMTIALSPDGSFDLAGLAKALVDVAEDHGDDFQDVVVGDYTLRCDMESGGQIALPTMIDDHLVILMATDMENSGAMMLSADNRGDVGGAGKALHLHVAVEQAISTLLEVGAAQMANNLASLPIDAVALFNDLGVGCLRTLDVSIAADGDVVVMETNVATSAENRGMFGAFCLDHGAPKILRYLPPSATAFSCQAFDLGAIYQTISKVWSGIDELAEITFEEVEAAFEDATKVRLREDLIDHLGTEMLSVADFETDEDLDEENMMGAFGSSCYALSLRDGAAFGEALEKALRSRGLHAARKSDEYQGVKVYRLRLAGMFEIEYSVTDDLLLLALGSDEASRAQLRSILDARANPTAGIPESIRSAAEHVPAGWNGVGITPFGTLLQGMGKMMPLAGPELPPGAAMMFDILGALGAEMEQIGLNNAVQFGWSSPTGLRSILRL